MRLAVFSQNSVISSIDKIEIFMVNPYENHGVYAFTKNDLEKVVIEGLLDKENSNDYYYKKITNPKAQKKLIDFANYNGEKCKNQPSSTKSKISVLIKYTFTDSTIFLLGIVDYYTFTLLDGNSNTLFLCNNQLNNYILKITPRRFLSKKRKGKELKCEC